MRAGEALGVCTARGPRVLGHRAAVDPANTATMRDSPIDAHAHTEGAGGKASGRGGLLSGPGSMRWQPGSSTRMGGQDPTPGTANVRIDTGPNCSERALCDQAAAVCPPTWHPQQKHIDWGNPKRHVSRGGPAPDDRGRFLLRRPPSPHLLRTLVRVVGSRPSGR